MKPSQLSFASTHNFWQKPMLGEPESMQLYVPSAFGTVRQGGKAHRQEQRQDMSAPQSLAQPQLVSFHGWKACDGRVHSKAALGLALDQVQVLADAAVIGRA